VCKFRVGVGYICIFYVPVSKVELFQTPITKVLQTNNRMASNKYNDIRKWLLDASFLVGLFDVIKRYV
jgi:hypothetical protein